MDWDSFSWGWITAMATAFAVHSIAGDIGDAVMAVGTLVVLTWRWSETR